jgi:hypothetical protein
LSYSKIVTTELFHGELNNIEGIALHIEKFLLDTRRLEQDF